MAYEFRTRRTVEFYETDMAGIVHFSNFFRFMETAEHEFFRSLGLSLHDRRDDGSMSGWARVEANCTFSRAITYMDEVEIHLLVCAKTRRSITYRAVFRKKDADGWEEIARGSLKVVCVTRDGHGQSLKAVEIPANVDAAIEVAPPELLESPE